jgi:SpoVK/Ycf46/Vps4 family AAA+-type ATPase
MHRKEGLRTPAEFMITPTVTWSDVFITDESLDALVRLADRRRSLATSLDSAEAAPGAGELILFAGDDRRNRRLAAEALAHAIDAPVLRVDLGAVDSKWIAETEANLDRIFRAADRGSVVVLMDEADALFGSRTDVKDSHDRYSSQHVAYLLSKIEAHEGLSIVATSRKSAIDPAFIRRATLQLDFPRS